MRLNSVQQKRMTSHVLLKVALSAGTLCIWIALNCTNACDNAQQQTQQQLNQYDSKHVCIGCSLH